MDFSLPETSPDTQEVPSAPPAEEVHWGRILLDILETVVLAVVLFLGINAVSARVRVDGSSMIPTLQNGEFVLVNRLAYRLGETERGDIIVFRSINEPDLDLIKRIIGLPGEIIEVRGGQVLINDKLLKQPMVDGAVSRSPEDMKALLIPRGMYFVMGDNRGVSFDSRLFGPVPEKYVFGKAFFRYWPPAVMGKIE